jgi:hypothetical protein
VADGAMRAEALDRFDEVCASRRPAARNTAI